MNIWTFKCPAANTKDVIASVCPSAPGSQAFFNVTIVGKTPASILGKGDIQPANYATCAGTALASRRRAR